MNEGDIEMPPLQHDGFDWAEGAQQADLAEEHSRLLAAARDQQPVRRQTLEVDPQG